MGEENYRRHRGSPLGIKAERKRRLKQVVHYKAGDNTSGLELRGGEDGLSTCIGFHVVSNHIMKSETLSCLPSPFLNRDP